MTQKIETWHLGLQQAACYHHALLVHLQGVEHRTPIHDLKLAIYTRHLDLRFLKLPPGRINFVFSFKSLAKQIEL